MKRSSLRGFGIACLLIGILYTGMNKFLPNTEAQSEETIADYEEKISELEEELKEAKEQILLLEKSNLVEEPEESETNPVTEEPPVEATSEENDEVVEGVLYIYSGLTPYEVSKKLEDMGIIQNAVEMELFLAQPQYSRSIQKGQFEVNSSMTVEEIANLITGKTKSPNK